ncbi:Probable transmembrane protein [Laribacter hongkongensis HLHK9]|uniref:Probable transmembrane protein n=1 Tax=Laribacter hongkongensis (strain HLHK9) TaxID=557598 RepID=C1D5N6_LARHH|nr:DMT family transporter [Laribacter hongkongensis]ACO76053.1 Probable transmembrane protein [Laribacter hongkongensis HLHK9]
MAGTDGAGHHDGRRAAVAMALVAVALWSSNAVVARFLGDAISPWMMSWLRWLIPFIVFLPLVRKPFRSARRKLLANARLLVMLSGLGFVAHTVFFYVGLTDTTAINASALLSLTPIWIMLILLARGAPVTPVQWAGIVLSIAGSLVIITEGSLAALLQLHFQWGDLAIIASGITWAGYTLLLPRLHGYIPPVLLMMVLMGVASIMQLPIVAIDLWYRGAPALDALQWSIVGYAGIICSFVGFALYNKAVKQLGSDRAGVFLNLMPLMTALESVLFLSEDFMGYHLAGMLVILCGLTLAVGRFRLRRPLAPPAQPAG